ncbi:riboflavin synthase [Cellulosilyticum sp. WCF-2]|uniref:riboflavin synthase n=1 Tax=Cellulosilyticum sp. WCF-2 TaxID=2497860 RepID=UPI000F8E0C37|nr:riboflavin synthase [Cellulosilyticum sp. WCF-2]QEH69886.1 riboflavin synthase [Cellulosilyticum sp. WCF-2]
MFTGIVEEIGHVEHIQNGEKFSRIKINAVKVLEQSQIGDSIATNGVCLTITNMTSGSFEADIMAETLRKSNLGSLRIGAAVNLERAMRLSSRLGGHLVSGHIDGIGEMMSITKEAAATWITIKAPAEILRYVVLKGSIAIDGISLTVADVTKEYFKVSVIPHTKNKTTLLMKGVTDQVNLEVDIIGKYVERLLGLTHEVHKENKIDEDFLKKHGFM